MTWETVLIVVGVVVLIPYVLGPLAVKATMKFNPRPLIQEVDPAVQPIPEEVRSYCFGVHEQFTRLGFEAAPLLRIDGMMSDMHTYVAMYLRQSDGQQAMAAVNFATAQGKVKAKRGYVEFATDFRNGGSVMTNDSTEVAFGPRTHDVVVVKAPWVRSVAKLLELHKEACRRHGVGDTKRDTAPGWPERAILDSLDQFVSRCVAHGYLEANADGTYGVTWKGALIGTYTNLPPGSWVAKRRGYAAARELMRFVPGAPEYGR